MSEAQTTPEASLETNPAPISAPNPESAQVEEKVWPDIVPKAADSAPAEVVVKAEGKPIQYALIKGGEVVNVIMASPEFAALVQADYDHVEPLDTSEEQSLGVGIGWGYKDGKFVAPAVPEPEPVKEVRDIQAGALYLRFNFAERAGIMLAGTVNPAADTKTQQLQAQVATLRSDLMSARTISLDSPGLATGCKLLAGLNILGSDWEDRIIKAKVTPEEQNFGR